MMNDDTMTEIKVGALRRSGIALALEILNHPDSHDAYPADTAYWVMLRSLDRQAHHLGILMDYHRVAEAYKAARERPERCPHGRSVASRRDNPCPPGLAACRL
jgi:hypothetical protein